MYAQQASQPFFLFYYFLGPISRLRFLICFFLKYEGPLYENPSEICRLRRALKMDEDDGVDAVLAGLYGATTAPSEPAATKANAANAGGLARHATDKARRAGARAGGAGHLRFAVRTYDTARAPRGAPARNDRGTLPTYAVAVLSGE